jgi:hypothetical protein
MVLLCKESLLTLGKKKDFVHQREKKTPITSAEIEIPELCVGAPRG